MIENLKDRYTEIIFYGTMQSMFRTNPDLEWILNFIELVCVRYQVNSLLVQGAARRMFREGEHPFKGEMAVVLYYAGIPVRHVLRLSKLSSANAYKYIYDYKDNPYPLKTQLLPAHRAEIIKFLEALKKFTKAIEQYKIEWEETTDV